MGTPMTCVAAAAPAHSRILCSLALPRLRHTCACWQVGITSMPSSGVPGNSAATSSRCRRGHSAAQEGWAAGSGGRQRRRGRRAQLKMQPLCSIPASAMYREWSTRGPRVLSARPAASRCAPFLQTLGRCVAALFQSSQ